jgi:predicted nucleic acid-binding protein
MKYVLDASVALKWVLPEADSPIALRLRSAYQRQIHELIAPDVFPAECGHGLSRAERRRAITVGTGTAHLGNIGTTLPHLHSTIPLLYRASVISSATRASFYDSLYVALAGRPGKAVPQGCSVVFRVFRPFSDRL